MEEDGASAFASVVTRIEDRHKRERERASESRHAHGRESARARRDREREIKRESRTASMEDDGASAFASVVTRVVGRLVQAYFASDVDIVTPVL